MKHIATAAAALLAAMTASAAPLSPEQALTRATGDAGGANRAPSLYTLAMTRMVAERPAFYLFNAPTGFLIAPADDRFRPCLAEGTGAIDPDRLPCNVEMWLDNYAQEIAWALDNTPALPAAAADYVPAMRAPVAPLCTTQWDQNAPFYNDTPVYNGRHAVTGCSATAMGQIMKKFAYPEHGIGSTSYEWQDAVIEANFADATYEWGKMIDSYTSAYTDEQAAAVAKLIGDCGIALHMQYGVSISGSYEHMIPYALTTNFGYDPNTILMVYRAAYATQTEWDDLIYAQLAAGYPVQYNGQSPGAAGHSFVCDGYSADGLFHINWGWSGYCDGYFALTALSPSGQGTGGASGGYNTKQSAVIGIRPTPAGQPTGTYSQIMGSGDFTYNGFNFKIGNWVTNFAPLTNTFSLGLMVVAPDGTPHYFMSTSEITLSSSDGTANDYFRRQPTFSATPKNLAPGTYRVYPAVCQKGGNPRQLPLETSNNPMLYLTVSADGKLNYTATPPVSNARLAIKSFGPVAGGEIQPDTKTPCRIVIENKGTEVFASTIYYSVDNTPAYATSTALPLTLEPGAETNVDLEVDLAAGVHMLYVGDANLKDIEGSPYRIVCGATGALVVPDEIVPAGEFFTDTPLDFELKLTNVGAKDFKGDMTFGVFAPGAADPYKVEVPVELAAGATATVSVKVPAGTLDAGNYYACMLDERGDILSGYTVSFTIGNVPQLRLVEASCYVESSTTFKVDVTLLNEGPGAYEGPATITIVDANGIEMGGSEADIDIAQGRRQRVWVGDLRLPNGVFTVNVLSKFGKPVIDNGATFTVTNSGIDTAVSDAAGISVSGLTVTVSEPRGKASLVRPDGTVVDTAETPAVLKARQPGIYILSLPGSGSRVLLR